MRDLLFILSFKFALLLLLLCQEKYYGFHNKN